MVGPGFSNPPLYAAEKSMDQFSRGELIFASIADQIELDWRSIARPEQLPPSGDWSVLAHTGGPWGRERPGPEPNGRRALAEAASVPVSPLRRPTSADVRDVMVEGSNPESAICAQLEPPDLRTSKRQPDLAERRPGGDVLPRRAGASSRPSACGGVVSTNCAPGEKFAAHGTTCSSAFASEKRPRQVITTTPRPIKFLKELVKRARPGCVVTRGRTSDDPAANLAPSFFSQIVRPIRRHATRPPGAQRRTARGRPRGAVDRDLLEEGRRDIERLRRCAGL